MKHLWTTLFFLTVALTAFGQVEQTPQILGKTLIDEQNCIRQAYLLTLTVDPTDTLTLRYELGKLMESMILSGYDTAMSQNCDVEMKYYGSILQTEGSQYTLHLHSSLNLEYIEHYEDYPHDERTIMVVIQGEVERATRQSESDDHQTTTSYPATQQAE